MSGIIGRKPLHGTTFVISISGKSEPSIAEAEAIRGAMIQLIKMYQVPSLPVHDSLLVPVSAIGLCREALTFSYKHHCKL